MAVTERVYYPGGHVILRLPSFAGSKGLYCGETLFVTDCRDGSTAYEWEVRTITQGLVGWFTEAVLNQATRPPWDSSEVEALFYGKEWAL